MAKSLRSPNAKVEVKSNRDCGMNDCVPRKPAGSRAELTPALLSLMLAVVVVGCNERPHSDPGAGRVASAQSSGRVEQPGSSAPEPTGSSATSTPAAPGAVGSVPPGQDKQYRTDDPKHWRLGELSDVGPAGPATATSKGVLMVTLRGELKYARLRASGELTSIDLPRDAFAAYGRGPALIGDRAYWIRGHSLLRGRVDRPGEPEVLANDAREGTRVAAARVGKGEKQVVGYISQKGEDLVARVWIEGGETLVLTPEGSQSTSINLVPSDGDLLAILLEGRTSMSPVHARRLFLRGKIPRVGEDVVVWVGPPAQPLTEVMSVSGPAGEAWSFLPLERTVTDFGLARFKISREPEMDVKVEWLGYPNGINPAPVATADICGGPVVLFARPSEQRPHSPQELHIARLLGGKLEASDVVARSRAFNNISLAPIRVGRSGAGALLVWTADWRTWARPIFCK